MRTTDDLAHRIAFGVLLVIACSQLLAGCGSEPTAPLGLAAPQLPDVDLVMFVESPPVAVPEPVATRRAHVEGRCEPLDQPFCTTQRDCSDGARCVRPWWAAADTSAMVCAMPMPSRVTQRWRAARLRVYVDHVCRRGDGCDPTLLAKYLGVMIGRESTWQPGDRHRLNPDLDGASEALAERRETFAGNPAVENPERWMTGLGYFGQNPAIWLPLWDPLADPEALCHEVVSTEVHLRAARAAVAKIDRGVDCDGDGQREFFGSGWAETDDGATASLYDASRVNSGSLCPGDAEHQRRFEVRARRAGLDPWAPVNAADFGESIPRDRQDEVAVGLANAMDTVPR